jgi:hypothetical protein
MTAHQWRYVSSHRCRELKVPRLAAFRVECQFFRADSVERLICLQALSFPLTIAHFWPSLMQGERLYLYLVWPYGACTRLHARVSIAMRKILVA